MPFISYFKKLFLGKMWSQICSRSSSFIKKVWFGIWEKYQTEPDTELDTDADIVPGTKPNTELDTEPDTEPVW